MMTKGEHTNKRTYVHKFVRDRPYIPSTTSLCEGIIILSATVKLQKILAILTVYVTIDFAKKIEFDAVKKLDRTHLKHR